MIDDGLPMGEIGMQRVRIVAEAGNVELLCLHRGDDVFPLRGGEIGDVDVAGSGIAPGRAAGLRPAGDLENLETSTACPGRDLIERRVGERGRQEAELHIRLQVCSLRSDAAQSPRRNRTVLPRHTCMRLCWNEVSIFQNMERDNPAVNCELAPWL